MTKNKPKTKKFILKGNCSKRYMHKQQQQTQTRGSNTENQEISRQACNKK